VASGLLTGPDNNLWFGESECATGQSSKIGRITPSGTISEFAAPENLSQLHGVTNGPDGNLWFVAIDDSKLKGVIGRMTTSGAISQFLLISLTYHSYEITNGPDGNLWFSEADLDGWHNRIGRITPSGTISEYSVPEQISRAYGIITGADGNLERITPAGKINVFPLSRPGIVPGNLAVGPDGKI
jgi:streptogramin lyase